MSTLTDLPLAELEQYRPRLTAPDDFDLFWQQTLADARRVPTAVTGTAVDVHLPMVEVTDLTFPGFGGDPVCAWLLRPTGLGDQPVPLVVEYHGYGGGRGLPHERLLWPAAGYATLVMDNRGQGSSWGNGGHTPDPHGSGPAVPGYLTRGILDPADHYVRRLITDAVRAVDAARTLPGIDHDRILVAGASQGGGLALAVAGLVPGLAAVLADVPFLCHLRRAVDVADSDPYQEVVRYLSVHREHEEAVFRTLSYVDAVHHGARADAPALFSVGLRDGVCPPSTVFAAYHAYAGPREIAVYPFNGHEGGQGHHTRRQLAWLTELLGPAA